MKKLLYLIFILLIADQVQAQQTYNDFDGIKVMTFGVPTGTLDSMVANPMPNTVNSSANCAMYIRDTTMYDLLKMYPNTKMVDVTPYANNTFSTPKIKMKVYSTAPVGTILNLQLGLKNNDTYPGGVHSEYVTSTTVQNGWQNLTFNFYQIPTGSLASPTDIDKMILLFAPGTNSTDTLYIDDIMGPQQIGTGITKTDALPAIKLFQNTPNPVKAKTQVSFQLTSPGQVTLKLYDMVGNPVSTILEENMKAGLHTVPIETENIPNGIYFYVLSKEGTSRSMKMIVSK